MQKKSDDFSEISLQKAMAIAKSDSGQQLLQLLQSQNGDALQAAMDQAAAGNYAGVKNTLNQLLASEDAQALIKRMQE